MRRRSWAILQGCSGWRAVQRAPVITEDPNNHSADCYQLNSKFPVFRTIIGCNPVQNVEVFAWRNSSLPGAWKRTALRTMNFTMAAEFPLMCLFLQSQMNDQRDAGKPWWWNSLRIIHAVHKKKKKVCSLILPRQIIFATTNKTAWPSGQ